MEKINFLSQAKALQKELAAKVLTTPLAREVSRVAGVDAALAGRRTIGAACLFSFPALELIACARAKKNLLGY
jgi:deoxyinosine 3'endonuclease (endonuclease V)